jgi:hypothetical protein
MSAHDNEKERTVKIHGKWQIEYLVSVLEKEYFNTQEAKNKKFIASLLSRLA